MIKVARVGCGSGNMAGIEVRSVCNMVINVEKKIERNWENVEVGDPATQSQSLKRAFCHISVSDTLLDP